MTAKHTPGPWELVACGISSDGHHDQLVADGRGAMRMRHDGSGEARANARLIAAAPELLEAAQNARNVLAALAIGDLKWLSTDSHALSALRAAIAKATGACAE